MSLEEEALRSRSSSPGGGAPLSPRVERLFRFVALVLLFVVMSAIVWVVIALVPLAFVIPGEFVMAFVLAALLLSFVTIASRLYILKDRVARLEREVGQISSRDDAEPRAPPTPPGPPEE